MSEVFCRCGYEGNQLIEFQIETPNKRLVEDKYGGYFDLVKELTSNVKTLNWACPQCNRILVQQRGGLTYRGNETEQMMKRLRQNSRDNERWYKAQQNKNTVKETKINNKIKRHVDEIEKLKKELQI
jgi:hypothetical protein